MNNLIIKPTKNTPYVSFDINGRMRIEGRSYMRDAIQFFEPLFDWAEKFVCDNLVISLKLEYFNTSTCKQLLSLLKLFVDNHADKNILIKWYYEEGDLDVLEIGEHFNKVLPVQFKFIEYAENINTVNSM